VKPIDMSQLLNQLSQSATEAPRSAVDRVFEDLRRRIVSLELAPDTTLVRTELCQEYGVSQTPVREALQRLEQAGLIKIFPQSRTQVARIEVGRLNETQFLREALESEVVRRLAQEHDARLVERLNGIIDMQAMLIGEPDQTAAFYRLDELFHETMFAGPAIWPGSATCICRAKARPEAWSKAIAALSTPLPKARRSRP